MRVRSFPPVASPWFLRCALVGAVAGSAAAQCYLPGGSLAPNQLPCDPFAMTAQCCPTGWTCFSNRLCVVTDSQVVSSQIPLGTTSRGSCTNPLWNKTACGDFCLSKSDGGALMQCLTGQSTGQWCCQSAAQDGTCNCDTGVGTFSIGTGKAQTIIGVVGLQYTATPTLPVPIILSPSPSQSSASTLGTPSSSLSQPSASTLRTSSSSLSLSSASTLLTSSSSLSLSSASTTSSSSIRSVSSSSSTSLTLSSSNSQTASSISQQSATTALSSSSQSPSSTPLIIPATNLTQTVAFKAGIGVAAGVLFLLLLAGIIFFLKKRRNQYSNPNVNLGGPSGPDTEVFVPSFRTPTEMVATPLSLPTSRPPSYPGHDDYTWSGGAAAMANKPTANDNPYGDDVGESSEGNVTHPISRNGAARKYAGVNWGRRRGGPPARPVSAIPEEEAPNSPYTYSTLR